jgi:hypothetical protein
MEDTRRAHFRAFQPSRLVTHQARRLLYLKPHGSGRIYNVSLTTCCSLFVSIATVPGMVIFKELVKNAES